MSPGRDRPRLVHIITGLGLGGAERDLFKLAAALSERYEMTVVSLMAMGPMGEHIADLGIAVHPLGMDRGRLMPAALPRLAALLHRLRPDLVHGWMYHGNLAAWAGVTLLRLGSPLLWSILQSPGNPGRESALTMAIVRFGAALSPEIPAIVYNARAAACLHRELDYRPRREVIIPNGFDTERFRPRPEAREALRRELGLAAATPLVGLIARHDPIKDHDTFLRAAREVAREWPEARFVLAGTGVEVSNPRLSEPISALGLGQWVHLLGERRDVPELTAALDIACLSSRGEGSPNVVGEAMASGVPCVVTDVGDAAAMVGDTGLVVPPGDPSALAGGILHLLRLGEEQRQLRGRAARARIVGEFALDAMVARYDHLYGDMLDVWNRGNCPDRAHP